ncbi:MAG: hypothetical protein QNJ37_12975 [Crocosphaera sp.]|nr:hypothetical protein [Crocosphaera sp.]
MNETPQLKNVWQILESRDQVILKARLENSRLQNMHKKLLEEQKRHIQLIEKLNQEIHQSHQEIHELTVRSKDNRSKQETLQHIIEQKDLTIEDIKKQLSCSEKDRVNLWQKIDQLQEQLNESQSTIEGMKSSKFWQLRQGFVRLKNFLRLTGHR